MSLRDKVRGYFDSRARFYHLNTRGQRAVNAVENKFLGDPIGTIYQTMEIAKGTVQLGALAIDATVATGTAVKDAAVATGKGAIKVAHAVGDGVSYVWTKAKSAATAAKAKVAAMRTEKPGKKGKAEAEQATGTDGK